jgi:hypothetical protein
MQTEPVDNPDVGRPASAGDDPYAVLRHRDFRLYLI